MSIPFFIATRYVRSKKDSNFISLISIISIIGIALGVAVLIISLTILNGFEQAITDKIIKFNSHVKITAFGNRNLPDYTNDIPKIEKKLKPFLTSISPFVSKEAIIRSKKMSEGILLTGILPELDNSNIGEYIIKGDFNFNSETLPSIIIGKKLAEKLFIDLGDKVTIFTLRGDLPPSYENPPAIKQFLVRGIYESGMSEYDDVNAYIELNTAQEMFDIGKGISGYNIKLNDISKIDSLTAEMNSYLGYPYYVRTIFQVHQNIFTWLELQKKPIPIILGLIIIVAVFNIVGTLLMIVLERTNTIGILRSLGATRRQVIKIFVYQGIYLAVIGVLIGNIIALVLSFIQRDYDIISLPDTVYFMSSVPIAIEWQNYLLVSAIAFMLCFAASLIPSFIASKIQPLAAIRFD